MSDTLTGRLRKWGDECAPTDSEEAMACEAADHIESLTRERDEARAEAQALRAARCAYASEFPPNADGEPDTGSIHANIRAMKAEAQALRADAERYRWITQTGEWIGDNWRIVWNKWDGSDGKAGFDAAIDSARSA